ncbi:YceH family protein [Thiocystis violacea]|uniref:YceH family protein n=1 Tax=Thiocystis violacea TaxID=13725 RepID=UPI001906725C|nr:YceH family protein [Thiocystis violacea]MBK1720458.1 DUF480 domain-containing protein [Thiocystis violacea]
MSNEHDASTSDALLTPVQARLLGCLMEKQRTTPDQYPLTLNGLVSACNQKSAREPVMNLSPGEIGHALNQLRDKGLIHVGFTGRTERYDHKMVGTYFLSREEQAILCVLMLRGPQTLGELRTNTGRMADFADLEAVASAVRTLATRDHSLVVELPRLPGKREERYAHRLCGEPKADEWTPSAVQTSMKPHAETKDERIRALESEIASLRADLDRLWELSGLADQRDT